MSRVAVNIVTWNSQDYIQTCLDNLLKQTYRDIAITVVDNASIDDTVRIISQHADLKINLIQNATNEGYAPGHNKAIAATDSEFVLNLNPDIVLTPTFIGRMLDAINQSPAIGSVAGKLISISPQQFREGLPDTPPNGALIDGAGLIMYKSRRQFLRGHGEDAARSCTEPAEIFGPDGAAPLYRRSMLENIKVEGEYFDVLFRSHKEDVDLVWRAQLLGWQSVYTPEAVAYHIRAFKSGQRVHLAARIRRDAVKNRWLMNYKNDLPKLVIQDLPQIAAYEIRILAYLILFERTSLPAIWDCIRLYGRMSARRRFIQGRRKRDSHYMRQWFM